METYATGVWVMERVAHFRLFEQRMRTGAGWNVSVLVPGMLVMFNIVRIQFEYILFDVQPAQSCNHRNGKRTNPMWFSYIEYLIVLDFFGIFEDSVSQKIYPSINKTIVIFCFARRSVSFVSVIERRIKKKEEEKWCAEITRKQIINIQHGGIQFSFIYAAVTPVLHGVICICLCLACWFIVVIYVFQICIFIWLLYYLFISLRFQHVWFCFGPTEIFLQNSILFIVCHRIDEEWAEGTNGWFYVNWESLFSAHWQSNIDHFIFLRRSLVVAIGIEPPSVPHKPFSKMPSKWKWMEDAQSHRAHERKRFDQLT